MVVWKGETDVVHFDYQGEGAHALNHINVLVFQKLWNCNNDNDRIEENGIYDDETEIRIINHSYQWI